jgi:hypothetical protein
MSCSIRLAVCLVALICTGGIRAQSPEAQTDENASQKASATADPVAHVYVATSNRVYAFSAAADGKLAPVPGSPFKESLGWMGANGHYLFGFEGSSTTIASFSMAPDGAIRKVATTNTNDFDSSGCNPTNGSQFRIDHSGQDLYNAQINDMPFCAFPFQTFRINDADGKLTFLGEANSYSGGGSDMSMLGNNQYAYVPACLDFVSPPTPARYSDTNYVGAIAVYQRLSDGELAALNVVQPVPAAPNDGADPTQPSPGFYCPNAAATDPTNHMALLLNAIDYDLGGGYGPAVIASYTADADGNLTTTSTYHNMPVVETGGGWMRMSPSGELLAVGGSGLELFHFNGGNPITKYKLLLPTDSINLIFWDNDNHMYAIGTDSAGAGELWVYTVTPTSVKEAPGSPYSIPNAGNLVVQPL